MKMILRSRGMPYVAHIVGMFRSNIVGFWPLHETAGATAYDHGPNGFNGTYRNISLANLADHHGELAPVFNGTNADVDLPDLSSKFSGDEGTLAFWARYPAGFFAGGDEHAQFFVSVDAQNGLRASYNTVTHLCQIILMNGGAWNGGGFVYQSEEVWSNFALTWSKSAGSCKLYLNGSKQYSDDTFAGNFVGSLSFSVIGSFGGYWGHSGHLSDVLLLNKAISADQVATIAHARNLLTLGDSITAGAAFPYWAQIITCEDAEPFKLCNRALGAQTIMSDMVTQVSNSIADNAALIIVALGTNDDNSGDMDTLKQEVIDQLYRLRLLHSNARMYYMNVLPRWQDADEGPEVDKSNIRAAIEDACAASDNVTCWDTYTDPWILQSDTSDGVHPTAAGQRKIADRVLALI